MKIIPVDLKLHLIEAVSIVNYIKVGPFKAQLFVQLCEIIELNYQSEVRRLSRGKVLNQVLQLKNKLRQFLKQEGKPFYHQMDDND